jgi:peptide/nickel transport system ATP-binding protein
MSGGSGMHTPLLRIEDLSVVYKTDLETVHALNGASIELDRRQTLGIVGETGAGKSTLALSTLRLLPKPVGIVTGGRVLFEGQDLAKLNEAEMKALRGNKISMIFQDPMTSLNPTMKVGDQIAESLLLHNDEKLGKAEITKRVEETLTLVGISPFRKDEYPNQFSGGMKQRVVIAMALACKPNLLIADEPTTALDVTIQAQVLSMMSDLKELLHTAMIMITHDLGIVAQICDQVAVMYAGEIIEYGTVADIFRKKEHHPYTVGLFGALPNLKIKSDRLSPIDGLMPDPTKLPPGCSFAPRCPRAMDVCKAEKPGDADDGGHRIRCFLFGGER